MSLYGNHGRKKYEKSLYMEMMEFVSQAGQDKWICEYFNYKKNGYFLDIGAHDGTWLSNSLYLEKELGWYGICVEPDKNNFDKLIKNRNCICINKAIYSENKIVEFAPSGIHGIRDHVQIPCNVETKGILVESITMGKLMADNNVPLLIDYISLDTEGADYNVLLGFPFDKYKVGAWTIEHNAYLDNGALMQKIREIMIKNGYQIARGNVECEGSNFEDWWINYDGAQKKE